MTVTQLGEDLGESPAKLHYHVRELERLGVIHLVETREKGGVLEKYYRAVARNIQVPPDVLRGKPPGEIEVFLREWMQLIIGEGVKAVHRSAQQPGLHPFTLNSETLWGTREDFEAALQGVRDVLKAYAEPQGKPGEREWALHVIAYPADLASPPESDPSSHQEEAGQTGYSGHHQHRMPPLPPLPDIPAMPSGRRKKRIFVVGSIDFSRADLERAIEANDPLDIRVVGKVTFAEDITPDLITRGIARFFHQGNLVASPAVREALAQKGARQT